MGPAPPMGTDLTKMLSSFDMASFLSEGHTFNQSIHVYKHLLSVRRVCLNSLDCFSESWNNQGLSFNKT